MSDHSGLTEAASASDRRSKVAPPTSGAQSDGLVLGSTGNARMVGEPVEGCSAVKLGDLLPVVAF